MQSNVSEPENRPKEKIEQLLSKPNTESDKRVYDRFPVEPGTEVYFQVICKGEIMDISDEGLSIRFKPSEAPGLEPGQDTNVSLELNNRIIKIPATIRRSESRFGVIVLGMKFEPDEIEVIENLEISD